jgi:AcrR family transcriptional regulator
MPVFVDREERRQLVVAVASRLIAEAGLDAVTVRDVAVGAQCSTAIVSHYFHNKREMLLFTYNSSIERATVRCEAALEGTDGDLKAYLTELMPLDEERLIEWRIWVAFWARAVPDPEIAEIQRACILRTRGNILGIMQRLAAKGLLEPSVDLADEARRVLTLMIGLAVQVMFDPDDWSPARQHGLIDGELAKLYRPGRMPATIAAQ